MHLSPKNIWRLALLVGQGAARDFLLAGRTVDADEALRLRVVERIGDDALRDALVIAEEIAASAPLTMQGHKRALNLVAEAQTLSPEARAEIAALEASRVRERGPPRGHGRVRREARPEIRGPLARRRSRGPDRQRRSCP